MANNRGPLNSTDPSTSVIVGGVYNAATPAPADMQPCALQLDNEGNLLVNVAIGAAAPTTVKIEDSSGNALNSNGAGSLKVASAGNKTNNNAAPDSTNVGVLPAVANAANPSWTEGDQVLASVDLSGHQRVVCTGAGASGSALAGNPVLIAGQNGGQARYIGCNGDGTQFVCETITGADGSTNTLGQVLNGDTGTTNKLTVAPFTFNGSTWDRDRTPAIFKTASVSATASGNTAVWTPTSGKKFRLMRFQITGVNLVATAATVITVSFQDATTGITIGTYDVLLPATATATGLLAGGVQFNSGWVDLGNGYLSASANNVLNCNISATVTGATGTFRVNACGTEE